MTVSGDMVDAAKALARGEVPAGWARDAALRAWRLPSGEYVGDETLVSMQGRVSGWGVPRKGGTR